MRYAYDAHKIYGKDACKVLSVEKTRVHTPEFTPKFKILFMISMPAVQSTREIYISIYVRVYKS